MSPWTAWAFPCGLNDRGCGMRITAITPLPTSPPQGGRGKRWGSPPQGGRGKIWGSPLKRFAPSPLRGEGRGGGDLSTGSITALRSSYETKNPSGQSNESRTPALADVTATPGRWSEVPSAAIDRSLHRRLCVSGIQTGCRSRWRATCGFTVGCKSRCLAEIRGLSGFEIMEQRRVAEFGRVCRNHSIGACISPPSQPPPLKGGGVKDGAPPLKGGGVKYGAPPLKGGGVRDRSPSPLRGEGRGGGDLSSRTTGGERFHG